MTASRARVLLLEDDEPMSAMLRDRLVRRGFACEIARTPAQAEAALKGSEPFDVLVSDVRLGADDGLDLVEKLRDHAVKEGTPALGVLVITAFGSLETALRAFRAGASDFLTKPFEFEQLVLGIERVLESRRLRGEIQRLRKAIDWRGRQDIVAKSPSMRAILGVVDRVADSDATVLVTGPSGSGKEVIARALHDRSRRAEQPFIAVNCAALPEQLLESELFGHRKGAFTDARVNRDGLFKAAHGGTLFLDELGELPLALQPKLLRVLQEREVTPLGANRPERVDVRVVAATNQRLEQLVQEKRFREDLYYRVNVIRIDLPPLATRPEDTVALAEAALDRLGRRDGRRTRLSPAAERALLSYTWPGNVRELENAMERAAALCDAGVIEPRDLPSGIAAPAPSLMVESAIARRLTVEDLVTEYCRAVVAHYGGNRTRAIEHLDVDRKTLGKRLPAEDKKAEGEA